jgi:hypothetical protein
MILEVLFLSLLEVEQKFRQEEGVLSKHEEKK